MPQPAPAEAETTTRRPTRLLRVSEAMAALSLSRSVLYEQLRSGRLRSVHQGRTRLIPETAILDYTDLLEREALNADRTDAGTP